MMLQSGLVCMGGVVCRSWASFGRCHFRCLYGESVIEPTCGEHVGYCLSLSILFRRGVQISEEIAASLSRGMCMYDVVVLLLCILLTCALKVTERLEDLATAQTASIV